MSLTNPPRIAIISTIREPGPSFPSWLHYHLGIGFDRIFLFLDDPHDPCQEIARSFAQVTVIPCNDALRARYATLANYPVFAQESATSTYARQMLHMELATRLAAEAGCQWLLHIDADELFFTPELDAHRHFDRHSQDDIQQLVYLNHEALPTIADASNPFRDIEHFKVNPRAISPHQEAEIAHYWLGQRGKYFIAYDNGKAAVRVQPGLTARGPHRFSTRTGPLNGKQPQDAWILHYVNSSYQAFRRKYEMRGHFPDTRPDGTPVKISFHLRARDLLAAGDEAGLRQLYETQVMMASETDLRQQMALGLVQRIPQPAEWLRDHAPADA